MMIGLSIAAVCGALAVYLTLPHRLSMAKFGGLIGAATLGLFFAWVARKAGGEHPSVYFYVFTFIAVAAAVRVISHPRPVYAALYFVLVVLATCGMLVMLEAEFMAFALVIIYAGAILVTYMFVIMLATEPGRTGDPQTSPEYDREARSPMFAVLMGFTLLALVGGKVFDPERVLPANHKADVMTGLRDVSNVARVDDAKNLRRFEDAMRELGMIEPKEKIYGVDLDAGRIDVREFEGSPPRYVSLESEEGRELIAEVVPNIDRVGLNLFKGHTMGIELAAVILLLAMVGAIVIAKRIVPEPGVETP